MSATNINRVTLTGNLTRDPELRTTQGGTAVCSMRVASNTRRKTTDGWADKANYFNVTVWGALAENCARFLSKGRPVALDGRLEWREWTGQDDIRREIVEIVADTVQFLATPTASTNGKDDAAAPARPEPVAAGGDPDDIPF
jgi:single-strand DNA-binding protein